MVMDIIAAIRTYILTQKKLYQINLHTFQLIFLLLVKRKLNLYFFISKHIKKSKGCHFFTNLGKKYRIR